MTHVDLPVTLDLSTIARDPEGDPLTYAWDLTDDGAFTDAAGPNPTVTAAQLAALGLGDGPFTATARVRVTDGFSLAVAANASLTVVNAPPTGGTASNSGPVP